MPYYRQSLTMSETSDYTDTNSIIVTVADTITGSTVPTTVINHTAGSSSAAEVWTIQIGNSAHYCYLTSSSAGTLDIYLRNIANSGNVQTTGPSYSAGQTVIPTMLWSSNVFVLSYFGPSVSSAIGYFIGQETSDWYAIWFAPNTLSVYHNADDNTQSYGTFAYPAQLTNNIIVQPINLVSSSEIVDIATPVIGFTNASNSLYTASSITGYGSNYFYWYNGLVVSDVV